MAPRMTSNRPYLIRALHEWIVDNGLTPHIVVNTTVPGVEVPEQHRRERRIVLNLGMQATRELELSNQAVRFEARFGGQPHRVHVPVVAVLGIYARENGQGLYFPEEDGGTKPPPEDPEKPPQPPRPSLKLVK
jgi:stringent starvation protein B